MAALVTRGICTWKRRARLLKTEVYAIYLAYRDPRTPWYARLFAAVVVAYAFSPLDIVPDFIPVLGYLDDLVLIPLGVALAIKMMPVGLQRVSPASQRAAAQGKPVSRAALKPSAWPPRNDRYHPRRCAS
jgi:uncharacterized membrane protein YkvA (DUF1232 family)